MVSASVDAFTIWWHRYRPIGSPENTDGPVIGSLPRLFANCGADRGAVEEMRAKKPRYLWTLRERLGRVTVEPGFIEDDAIGFYVTQEPWPPTAVRVPVESHRQRD